MLVGARFFVGSSPGQTPRVEPGTVRVIDAQGAPPSVPFWLGEAPARTMELSEEVSALRAGIDARRAPGDDAGALAWIEQHCGVDRDVANMILQYMAATRAALGRLPTLDHVVLERFFDDTGGM